MAQLAVLLLALFVQMERTYAIERAAHGAVATAKGRRVGPPLLVDPAKLEWAAHLRGSGHTIAESVEKTGGSHSLYCHLHQAQCAGSCRGGNSDTLVSGCRAGSRGYLQGI